MRRVIFILIILIAAAIFCCVQPKEQSKEYTIGVLIPETGVYSTAGVVMKNAAVLASKHAKEVLGVDVKLVFADCGDTAEKAKAAFATLAAQKVDAVVGAYSSPQTVAAADAAKEAKIVYIATVAATDEIEGKVAEGNRFVFRNAYNTSYWGILAAEFLGIKKAKTYIFVGYDPLKTFNEGLLKALQERTEAKMIEKFYYKSTKVAPDDYKFVAEKVAKMNADVIILGDSGADSINFVREYRNFGGNTTIYSVGGTLALPQVYKKLNTSIAFQAAALDGYNKTELTFRYFSDYKRDFGEDANNYAGILTYDAILILAQALKNGNLIEKLEKDSFKGAAGIYRFNEKHQALWGASNLKGVIAEVVDGNLKVLS